MNDDKNLLGRVTALALMLGAAYGVRAISLGGFGCPAGNGVSCEMETPAADAQDQVVPPAAPK